MRRMLSLHIGVKISRFARVSYMFPKFPQKFDNIMARQAEGLTTQTMLRRYEEMVYTLAKRECACAQSLMKEDMRSDEPDLTSSRDY